MSSSNSPCAACKCRRQKCTQDCIFAPYFPPDQTQKFNRISQVYGAGNIGKLLIHLNPSQREDAVNSLAYEAEYRMQDPVYGCVGLISILQNKLKQTQFDLNNAKQLLASCVAKLPVSQHPSTSNIGIMPYNMQQQIPMTGWLPMGAVAPLGASLTIPEPQQQQLQEAYEAAQQFATSQQQQEMFRTPYQEQQQQPLQDPMRFYEGGFGAAGPGQATATAFNSTKAAAMSSKALALISCETVPAHLIPLQQRAKRESMECGGQECSDHLF